MDAVLLANELGGKGFEAYNVATGDYITVREIAELALELLDLSPDRTRVSFGRGDRGWKGDVPIVRLDVSRIQALGWRCKQNTREALRSSMVELLQDARAGRL